MNKKSVLSFLVAIGTSVPAWASESAASTSLPYFGPGAEKCEIVTPQGEMSLRDASYLTDQKCEIIYVKPPLIGEFKMNEPNFLRHNDCRVRNRMLATLEKTFERAAAGELILDPELYNKYNKTFLEITEFGSDVAYSQITGNVLLRWNELMAEYRKLNPGKFVRPLPISVGLLSANRKLPDFMAGMSSIDDTILKQTVLGLELPDMAEARDDWSVPDFVKSLVSKGGDRPIIMGQAAGLELMLNLAGTCSLLDQDGKLSKDPGAYFAATYTYFYPVQTSASFSVDWDDSLLEEKVLAALKEYNGVITGDQLAEKLEIDNVITISINPGAFGETEEAEDLRREFQKDVMRYASEVLLTQISSNVKTIIDEATQDVKTIHTQRTCKRRLFGSKKCSTHQYVVTTKQINWALVRRNLEHLIRPTHSEAVEYRNYYMLDSSVFESSYAGRR